MNILMAAAESVPFVKVGGLADVVPSIARELDRLNVRVRVVLPLYLSVREGKFRVEEAPDIAPLRLSGSFAGKYRIYRAFLPGSSVEFLFIEHPEYFDRKGIYDNPITGKGYADQGERFLFFSKAVAMLILSGQKKYDVIHIHDNHVGPVAGYLRINGLRSRIIYHIHNLGYQGNYPAKLFTMSGFPAEWFWAGKEAEFFGKFSFMKLGILLSDEVVTVSPQYAKEIVADPEFGMGMEGILATKGKHLRGILNGIDIEEWNPETDPLIPNTYSRNDMGGKLKNKSALRRECRLAEPAKDFPVIGMVTRLAEQKGIDLVIDAMRDLVKLPLQMVILGTGQLSYQDALMTFSKKYPSRLSVQLRFDNRLAHLIEAGSDFFLMPSRYEPCGLNQLYSLRYGTIPIVRGVGGLLDTVRPVSSDGSDGWGFVFDEMKTGAMMKTISDALNMYRRKAIWAGIVDRAMSLDFSWKRSALQFLKIYKERK